MRPLSGICLFGVFVTAMMAMPSARTTLVSFTIDDDYPGLITSAGGAGVFSDTAVSGTNQYYDYRIDPHPPLNWCVDAEPFSGGNLFVRLNRKLDGEAGVLRCTENPGPDGITPGVQRNFVLKIADAEACEILSDPLAGLPLTDSSGNEWGVGSTAPCTLAHNENPRIRLGTLYKAKASTTKMDFLTVMFNQPNSYEIRSDTAAPIETMAGLRTVKYTGTFRLVKFEPGKRARAVGPSFVMPVRMDFLKH